MAKGEYFLESKLGRSNTKALKRGRGNKIKVKEHIQDTVGEVKKMLSVQSSPSGGTRISTVHVRNP